ncbi:hypothetical protein cyc_01095 [Cyclospora cayetanensis]|uniref:Transmembrane protein n=1 Tax=Cyclospora cayetanensis TaxID=88456 RepID=A0A1D3CS53_9EIME|nr:hypothetical protein cyc_01095 [Cyclospora cayetanensis]
MMGGGSQRQTKSTTWRLGCVFVPLALSLLLLVVDIADANFVYHSEVTPDSKSKTDQHTEEARERAAPLGEVTASIEQSPFILESREELRTLPNAAGVLSPPVAVGVAALLALVLLMLRIPYLMKILKTVVERGPKVG